MFKVDNEVEVIDSISAFYGKQGIISQINVDESRDAIYEVVFTDNSIRSFSKSQLQRR